MSKLTSASTKLLFQEAVKRQLNPLWLVPESLFTFSYQKQTFNIYSTKTNLNTHLGSRLTENKVMTRLILEQNHISNIPYCYTTNLGEAHAFFDQQGPLIAKPIKGSRASLVVKISHRKQLQQINLRHILLEKYIYGREYRCLVINHQVVATQFRELTPTKSHPWKKTIHNLSIKDVSPDILQASINLSHIFHAGLLAVDWLCTNDASFILELNSSPGIYSFHFPDKGKPQNIAAIILDSIILQQEK